MKNKILITVYLLIVGGVIYFAYPVIKSRYFQSSEDTSTQEESNENEKSLFNNSSNSEDEDESDDIPDESTVPDDVFIEVDAEDCEDNCEQFEDAEDKKYCQEYCGLNNNESTASTDDCEKLEDLEKDYCYKNQALAKKDFSLCKKIVDKKLLESCKTRLTEEIINGSNPVTE
ncbi:MAG: hypothetical protein ACWGHO_01310 [Candidatus Moraniibacteriota bacterium]